jgi:NAD(P)-dependent dehydrogenase (short-subunit alcohol dehydrogenase family)
VTGGSSGIGVETCRALAKAGARVYLCARSKQAAEAVIESIK